MKEKRLFLVAASDEVRIKMRRRRVNGKIFMEKEG